MRSQRDWGSADWPSFLAVSWRFSVASGGLRISRPPDPDQKTGAYLELRLGQTRFGAPPDHVHEREHRPLVDLVGGNRPGHLRPMEVRALDFRGRCGSGHGSASPSTEVIGMGNRMEPDEIRDSVSEIRPAVRTELVTLGTVVSWLGTRDSTDAFTPRAPALPSPLRSPPRRPPRPSPPPSRCSGPSPGRPNPPPPRRADPRTTRRGPSGLARIGRSRGPSAGACPRRQRGSPSTGRR